MKIWYSFLLIILFSTAVFGIFSMHQGSNMTHEACFAARIQGIQCPGVAGNPFTFSLFHLETLENILAAVAYPFYSASFLLTAIFLLTKFAHFYTSYIYYFLARIRIWGELCLALFIHRFIRQFCYWISLHEHSPAAA